MSVTQIAERPKNPQTPAEAQDFIARHFRATVRQEAVGFDAGPGRILAKDIVALVDLPRFDASAMYGCAVYAADLDETGRARLRLTGVSCAGHPPVWALQDGEASEIFTGAVLPGGGARALQDGERPSPDFRATGWKAAYPTQG